MADGDREQMRTVPAHYRSIVFIYQERRFGSSGRQDDGAADIYARQIVAVYRTYAQRLPLGERFSRPQSFQVRIERIG